MNHTTDTHTNADLTDRVVDILEQEVDELKQELASLKDELHMLKTQLLDQQQDHEEVSHNFDRLQLYATAAIDVMQAPHPDEAWSGVVSAVRWLLYHGLDQFNDGEPLARTLVTPTLTRYFQCGKQDTADEIPF